VDDERAETYVRLRAEVELRRVGDQLRGLDAVAGTGDRPAPGMPFALAETALWKVIRAGRILVAAGALDQDYLDRLAADLNAAIYARSQIMLTWHRRRGMRHAIFAPSSGQAPPSGRAVRRAGSRPSGGRCGWLAAARRRCCTSCHWCEPRPRP